MIKENHLIAIVRQSSPLKGFITDFFFKDEKGVRGANKELSEMIENFNASQKEKAKQTREYFMTIPYKTNGYNSMSYSFGCGNTHYLQQSVFKDLCKVSPSLCEKLALHEVESSIQVYLPNELQMAQEAYNFQF